MKHVYLLWHMRPLGNGDTDDKLIGAYSSTKKAEESKERSLLLSGFKDYPNDFVIDRYTIDEDNWTEGFG